MAENSGREHTSSTGAAGKVTKDGVQRILPRERGRQCTRPSPMSASICGAFWKRAAFAQPLDEFIGDEAEFEARGYTPAPAVARPVQRHSICTRHLRLDARHLRQSRDLVEQAGGSDGRLPGGPDFDGIIELGPPRSTRSRPPSTASGPRRHDWRGPLVQSFLGGPWRAVP